MLITSFTAICQIVNDEVGHILARIWSTYTFLILLYYGPEWVFNEFEDDYLEELHQRLYDDYEMEFGPQACSYNWHAFYHMHTVRKLGRAHLVSTEAYESAYGHVKNAYQPGTRNISLQIVRNMMMKGINNHTPDHCDHELILEPERVKSVRFDDSVAVDEQLNYYKIIHVNGDVVTVLPMETTRWECPWDPTLPFHKVGAKKFKAFAQCQIELDKRLLLGKGVLLDNKLLVPFYWDMLYS